LLWSLQVGEISRHDVRMYTMATLRNLI